MSVLRIGLGEIEPQTRDMLTAKHLGQQVTVTVTGNVREISADMIDISDFYGLSYTTGEEQIELLVTLVELS